MLLLQFIQQHRGEVLILHRVGRAIVVVGDELGIDLGHFFRDQAVLQRALAFVVLRLIEEGDRPQLDTALLLLSPMSRTCSLKRREETVVPSCPFESTNTPMPLPPTDEP